MYQPVHSFVVANETRTHTPPPQPPPSPSSTSTRPEQGINRHRQSALLQRAQRVNAGTRVERRIDIESPR